MLVEKNLERKIQMNRRSFLHYLSSVPIVGLFFSGKTMAEEKHLSEISKEYSHCHSCKKLFPDSQLYPYRVYTECNLYCNQCTQKISNSNLDNSFFEDFPEITHLCPYCEQDSIHTHRTTIKSTTIFKEEAGRLDREWWCGNCGETGLIRWKVRISKKGKSFLHKFQTSIKSSCEKSKNQFHPDYPDFEMEFSWEDKNFKLEWEPIK